MDWIITPFIRALDFKGRSRRKEYWLFVLFHAVMATTGLAIFAAIGGIEYHGIDTKLSAFGAKVLWVFILVWFLIFALPMLAISVRRWHDLGYTGWMFLLFAVLGAIPLVGFFASIGNIIWLCMPGTAGPNKYGDNPLDAPYQGYVQ